MISYSFTGGLRSDLADSEFLHGIAGDDDRELRLVSEKEAEQLLADRHVPAGHDPAVHGLFGDPDVECVFHIVISLSGKADGFVIAFLAIRRFGGRFDECFFKNT